MGIAIENLELFEEYLKMRSVWFCGEKRAISSVKSV
jgi:hypothetical protein